MPAANARVKNRYPIYVTLLHNINILRATLNGSGWKGQKVGVAKRNMIIPQIEWAEEDDDRTKAYFMIPHNCPVCGKPVLTDNLHHTETCCSRECSLKKAHQNASLYWCCSLRYFSQKCYLKPFFRLLH